MLQSKLINKNKSSILRSVLLAFGLFFVFVSVVLAFIYITAQKRYSYKFYEEVLKIAAYTKSMQLNDYFKSDLVLSQAMSKSPLVISFLTNPEDTSIYNHYWKEFNNYKSSIIEDRKIFFVSKANKKFYFDSTYAYIVDDTSSEYYWFDSTLSRTDSYNFNLDHDPALGLTLLWINFPVFNGSEAVGMLGLGIDIDKFANEMEKEIDLVSDFLIFNEHGELLLYENRELVRNKTNVRSVVQKEFVDEILDSLNKGGNNLIFKDGKAYLLEKLPFMRSYLLTCVETDFAVGFGEIYLIVMSFTLTVIFVFLTALYKFVKMTISPLHYLNNLTKTILKDVPIYIAVFSGDGKTTLISRYFSEMLHKNDILEDIKKMKGSFEITREFKMKDGKTNYFKIVKMNIEHEPQAKNVEQNSVIYLLDVSEQMYLANTDSLTNIANKRSFNERANSEFYNSLRDKKPLSFLMMDIDHFKKFNDTFGHLSGDIVLSEIAKILTQIIERRTDLVGRVGGEEFAVMLHNTDLDGAKIVAEKIRHAVEKKDFHLKDFTNPVKITISIGIYSAVPFPTEDFNVFLNEADKKLYEAKSLGKNKVCF